MEDFWNTRYSQPDYAYGIDPNIYFREQLDKLNPGKILLPAEGEGRNAAYAAKNGWDVHAFDISTEGRKKALALAQQNNTNINYTISNINDFNTSIQSFDVIALIYAHFPSTQRTEYHKKVNSLLKKGGTLIIEGFNLSHIENQKQNPTAGGPKDASMLYTIENLKADFQDNFNFSECHEKEISLSEGKYHEGKAAVIRLTAIKK
ncbi:class I SAM-dependent methyltransferase [Flavobacterium sp. C4GT6]|uniref:class I SAM-dependent methyltransferase n=1 Tax=Flavobacterium sp. C4GT6 TaxID=3103818 RepID=UPI002ED55C0B